MSEWLIGALIVIIGLGAVLINDRLDLKDDNVIEEKLEELVDDVFDEDVDFTPDSEE